MSLKQFLNAAYALFVEIYAAIPGTNMLEAIDRTNQAFGIEATEQAPVEVQNEQSLKQLEAMMRGVQ